MNSIGFKSGDNDGWFNVFTLFSYKKSLVDLEECAGALSYINIHY